MRHDWALALPDAEHPVARVVEADAGVACAVVEPRIPLPGRPWVWRSQHFLIRPEVDRALLDAGYHLAWIDTADLYGSPRAVERMVALRLLLTDVHHLGRAALLGYGEGATSALNLLATDPTGIACVVVDNPVCDVRSWPAGMGTAQPDAAALEHWSAAWDVPLDTLRSFDFQGSPLDRVHELAAAEVPLLVGFGTEDRVVPPAENAERLVKHLRDVGCCVRRMPRHGGGHHPLGPEDPAGVAQWVHRWTVDPPAFVEPGDPLVRSARRLAAEEPLAVGFLGGSLTEVAGWTALLRRRLTTTYPGTAFRFVLGGRASVDSTGDAFRVEEDLLGEGPLDLVLVDSAVNDRVNGRSPTEVRRALEGVVLRLRRESPGTDVVLVVLPDEDKLSAAREGRVLPELAAARAVARQHGLPILDVAAEVAFRIEQGELDWLEDFGGVHPKAYGYRVYEGSLGRALLDLLHAVPADAVERPSSAPALDPQCYDAGRMWRPGEVLDLPGAERGEFELLDPWTPLDGAGMRRDYAQVPALVAETPGATCRLPFRGRAVGVVVAAGPDAGTLEWRVDDGAWGARSLFTPWSAGLHLPWWHVLASDLDPDREHVLELRVGAPRDPASRGHAVRVLRLLVNG